MSLRARVPKRAALSAAAVAALGLIWMPAAALAKQVHLPLGTFGSAAQPSFTAPVGLAVDQSSGDLYAVDRGRNEIQQVTVSATAGQFKLKFGGQTTANLAFNASAATVQAALESLSTIGPEGLFRDTGGPGDATGSSPYVIKFEGPLAKTDVEALSCENGTVPLSGGSGCSVTTTAQGVKSTIERFKSNGEPADFSALEGGATNVIDGQGAGDGTPQNGLFFGANNAKELQIAVDDSGTATDGDLYVTQAPKHAVDVFASSGEYLGQLTEFKEGPLAEGPSKPLSEACGVGVDSEGSLYVGDYANGVNKFKQPLVPHNPLTNADNVANFVLPVAEACTLAAGAGPTAGYLFADDFTGELFKLDASTGALQYGGKPIVTGVTTVTVDPATGHLYAAQGSKVLEYDASGSTEAKLLATVTVPSNVTGIAVDKATGHLYVAREGSSQLEAYGPLVTVPDVSAGAASGIGPEAATLHGTISAANGPEAHCHFQYATEAAYLADKAIPGHDGFAGAASAPCEPAGPFSGEGVNAVSAKAEPLAHETRYVFRIVGENEDGSNSALAEHENTPATPCPHKLDKACQEIFETFGKPHVKGGEASGVTTTSAEIAGEVNPGGQQTSFAVEYVSEADFQHSGYNKATSVPSPPEDLGETVGFLAVSQELTELQPETAYRFRLAATNPDGTTLGPEGTFATLAPPSGMLDHRAWELVSPVPRMGEVFTPEPGPRAGLGGSCKSCTPGWNNPKAPMQSSPDGDAVAYEGDPFATGLAAESNSYISRRTEGGWQTTGLSEPQFTAKGRNVQDFKAFSPSLSIAVLEQTNPPLTAQAPEGFTDLYLREEGKGLTTLNTTEPPNRLPGEVGANHFEVNYAGANAGTESVPTFSHVVFQANDALTPAEAGTAPKAPAVGFAETDLYEWSGGQLHLVNVLPGNATAAPNATIGSGRLLAENLDFDHAISADGSRVFWSKQPSGQVYVREGGTKTVEIPDHAGKFLTASADGSEVLLSDGRIYGHLEAEPPTEEADLSAGKGGFQGLVGASEDLSRIYFVDTKALTPPEEENANGEAAGEGKDNLYLWQAGGLSFIGQLAALDNHPAGGAKLSVWSAAAGSRLAQASADGRFLAFESTAPITGYDNTIRGEPGCTILGKEGSPTCFEVFEYDAQTHTLACASCNPSGERPAGGSNLALINTDNDFFPQPNNLPPAGEGRLFFESLDALTPEDTNGRIQDVYEFEPDGVGSCERTKGCLALVSAGHGPKDSQFIDASATGDDAFFTTRDQLVPVDRNEYMDLYDARVGGGIASPNEPPPCLGEACKGASSLEPGQPGAASATFAGPGNEPPKAAPCRKGLARRHGRCIKPRHHRQAKHRKRAAKHNRGGSR